MNESHKKIIVPYLKDILEGLKTQVPDLESLTNPTIADLDKIFMALGRAVYRENLISKVNEMISRDYGRYPALSDPVLELVELRENCQKQIDLLNRLVAAILYHNQKKEAKNGNTNSENPTPVLERPAA
jgi:hypothetical protein